MWQKIKDTWSAFWKNPIKFTFDPGYIVESQVEDRAAEGWTVAQIDQTLDEQGFKKGSTPYAIWDGTKYVVNTIIKNLPLILGIVILLVIAWYFLMFKKAVE